MNVPVLYRALCAYIAMQEGGKVIVPQEAFLSMEDGTELVLTTDVMTQSIIIKAKAPHRIRVFNMETGEPNE